MTTGVVFVMKSFAALRNSGPQSSMEAAPIVDSENGIPDRYNRMALTYAPGWSADPQILACQGGQPIPWTCANAVAPVSS
jgi:hypothetical protein